MDAATGRARAEFENCGLVTASWAIWSANRSSTISCRKIFSPSTDATTWESEAAAAFDGLAADFDLPDWALNGKAQINKAAAAINVAVAELCRVRTFN